MFLENLKDAVTNQCGLKPELPILVGVSGGADSLALMFGFETLGYSLRIAHLDHGLREDSKEDADYIQELCLSRGLPFVHERIDVGMVAESTGQSIEEAARNVRYQFLFEQARTANAQAVAVGHHADDQVETVLMHFLRGSALPGLTGMAFRDHFPIWDDRIPLVRPLLGIWRKEIDAYLESLGFSPRIDYTNQDVTYFRNKLRHVLIPQLENYNPQIKQAIWRMSDVLKEENNLMGDLTQQAWDDCFIKKGKKRVILSLSKFVETPKAIQRRLLRDAISELRPDLRDVGYDAVEHGLDFANDVQKGGEIDLVSKLDIAKFTDYLIIKTWGSDLPDWQMPLLPNSDSVVVLDIDKPAAMRHGWWLEANLLDSLQKGTFLKAENLNPKEAWLDYDRLEMPLLIRGRRPGDRWQPLGMGDHTQKLKDFFINEKIPVHLRDIWPLVCSGEDIAWVVGLRPSEIFKVTQKTKRILHLSLVRKIA